MESLNSYKEKVKRLNENGTGLRCINALMQMARNENTFYVSEQELLQSMAESAGGEDLYNAIVTLGEAWGQEKKDWVGRHKSSNDYPKGGKTHT